MLQMFFFYMNFKPKKGDELFLFTQAQEVCRENEVRKPVCSSRYTVVELLIILNIGTEKKAVCLLHVHVYTYNIQIYIMYK